MHRRPAVIADWGVRPVDGAWLAALGAIGDLRAGALKRRDVPRVVIAANDGWRDAAAALS